MKNEIKLRSVAKYRLTSCSKSKTLMFIQQIYFLMEVDDTNINSSKRVKSK